MQFKWNRRAGSLPLIAILGALATAGIVAPSVIAQNGTVKKESMSKAAKIADVSADKNVKNATRGGASRGASKAVQPAKKGGAARAGVGRILVDNWTRHTIDIYVDGDYVGDVSPYGEAAGYYSSGSHTLYARDENGGSWGPRSVTLGSGTYTWQLNN